MVANLVDADLLMLLTDTAGLYTADPHRNSNAKLIERVDKIDAHIESLAGGSSSERGTGGMATKIEAAKLATASGVAVVISNGRERDVIARLASGEAIGTFFQPVASRLESRKRWLLSQLSKGEIYVDSGAATALRRQNKSLLPAGVTKVGGEFERGDVVNIFDSKTGEKIACGISNYSSGDTAVIKGARSDRITELLGCEYGAELVHRDNLVAL
jgi:glutamate 5-kinase